MSRRWWSELAGPKATELVTEIRAPSDDDDGGGDGAGSSHRDRCAASTSSPAAYSSHDSSS